MIFLLKCYVLFGMIFVGFFVMFGLRVNLNVVIGVMVNNYIVVVDGEIICRVRCWYNMVYLNIIDIIMFMGVIIN